jgi:hypothetical protein
MAEPGTAPSFGAPGDFPVARCGPCGRDVLTHVHVDERGEDRRLCVHCDAGIDPAEVRWMTAEELAGAGYEVIGEETAGCGRPGCGQGRCAARS